MTKSADDVDVVPLPPDDRLCLGVCGKLIKPDWIPPVDFGSFRTPGRWMFANPCESCVRVLEEKRRAASAREDEKKHQEELAKLLGGRKPLETFTFDKYIPKTPSQELALHEMKNFSASFTNAYLWGSTGGGKTHLAAALASSAFNAGLKVEFWKTGPLLRAIRMKEPEEQDKMLKRWATADLFVLDDLGVGKSSEFSASIFYDLVDMRDMAPRNGLVVTSNLSLDDLAAKIEDDRLSSRLGGLCKGHILEIKGPDGRVE